MGDAAANAIECARCGERLGVAAGLAALDVTCPRCSSHWTELPYRTVDFTQGTPEWHVWRSRGLGCSDAPAIMGENPWKSREHVLKEKLGGTRKLEPNAAMRRGNALEPEARSAYERLTGVRVRPQCLESTRFHWLRASVDGLALDGESVMEIKCGEAVYRHAASEGRVPKHYMGQLQHILAVTGLARIDFWCYLPARAEVHLRIDRDDRYIDRLIETEAKFWQELEKRR